MDELKKYGKAAIKTILSCIGLGLLCHYFNVDFTKCCAIVALLFAFLNDD